MDEKQIQAQVDFIARHFHEIMNKFEMLEKQVKNALDLFDQIKNKVDGLGDIRKFFAVEIDDLSKKVSYGFENYNKDSVNLRNSLVNARNNHVDLKKEFEELKATLPDLNGKIVSVNSKLASFANNDAVAGLKKEIQDLALEVKNRAITMNDWSLANQTAHSKFNNDLVQVNSDISSTKDNLKTMIAVCSSIKEELAQHKQKSLTALQSQKNELIKAIEDKISAIPKPIIPSYDDAKKYVQDQVKAISDEVKGATAKVASNESKIVILEKKIAQLQTKE